MSTPPFKRLDSALPWANWDYPMWRPSEESIVNCEASNRESIELEQDGLREQIRIERFKLDFFLRETGKIRIDV